MPKISIQQTVFVGTTPILTNPPLRCTDQVVGEVILPAASTVNMTSLTWYTCNTVDGTYVVAADVGTAGTVTVESGKAYKFPVELVGAAFVKPVGNVAGTIEVNLKS